MSNCPPPLVALVYHGSRDRRASQQFAIFVHSCQQRLPHWHVVGCQLELAAAPLSHQLQQAVQAVSPIRPISDVVIVPVLMAAGVHVREDIPAAIANTKCLCPHLSFHVTPPIGQAQQLTDVLASHRTAMPFCQAWVLWGHGSRRTSFATQFEQIAQMLSTADQNAAAQPMVTAYAKQEPLLENRVRLLYETGYEHIGILTGLLFPGWLSDRLYDTTRQLEAKRPQLHLYISPVLMPHALWVDAVRELVIGILSETSSNEQQAA
ncbi:MAG: CbiX/SirB N-terminal domain-containing protein [Cyanobacteria bacterium P01_E01_bin.34]